MAKNRIVEYVAEVPGLRTWKMATLVAVRQGDKVTVGWSKRHGYQEPRPFTKSIGRNIATGRAEKGLMISRRPATTRTQKDYSYQGDIHTQEGRTLPYDICDELYRFVERAKAYFQVDEIANYTDEYVRAEDLELKEAATITDEEMCDCINADAGMCCCGAHHGQ